MFYDVRLVVLVCVHYVCSRSLHGANITGAFILIVFTTECIHNIHCGTVIDMVQMLSYVYLWNVLILAVNLGHQADN